MITIEREEFKKDPVFNKVYEQIKKNHKVANHTIKTLTENKHIKDFCEEATHFMVMEGKDNNTFYLHYEVATWYPGLVKIDRICFYDDKEEYERARAKQTLEM